MAPLKFEEHIKDKLEQRKLQPSVDAWQKLNDQLDDNTAKKKNKTFWWFGIAAGFVGVLLVVTVMMNSEKENTVLPTVVDTEHVDSVIHDEIGSELITEEEKEQQKVNTSQGTKIKKSSHLKQKIDEEQVKLMPSKTEKAVANINSNSNEIVKKVNEIKTLTNEDEAVNTVVAAMQKLQQEKEAVINSEIDALLNEAQEEITLEKLYKEAMKSIDADALLQDVEQDLDVSFRDRVFKALKDSYKTVKTAVAERNN